MWKAEGWKKREVGGGGEMDGRLEMALLLRRFSAGWGSALQAI